MLQHQNAKPFLGPLAWQLLDMQQTRLQFLAGLPINPAGTCKQQVKKIEQNRSAGLARNNC